MEISINFPPMAIDGDVNCFFYAEPIIVDPNIGETGAMWDMGL
jgi:hypothetical protein